MGSKHRRRLWLRVKHSDGASDAFGAVIIIVVMAMVIVMMVVIIVMTMLLSCYLLMYYVQIPLIWRVLKLLEHVAMRWQARAMATLLRCRRKPCHAYSQSQHEAARSRHGMQAACLEL